MYRTWFAQGQVCRVWLALRLETQPSLQEDAGPTDVPAALPTAPRSGPWPRRSSW